MKTKRVKKKKVLKKGIQKLLVENISFIEKPNETKN